MRPGSVERLRVAPVGRAAPRRDIQGLRGIAVLLVMLAHAGVPGLGGGFLGVDVFFVLSGYLITSLLVREAERSGRVSIPRFYARRARRILPAATLVLVVTALAAALFLPFVEADRVSADVLWAAFFAANVHLAVTGTDYFNTDLAPSATQHFWSLAVEEQFYIVWPLLVLLVALGVRHRGRRSGSPVAGRVTLVAAGLSLVSLGWSVWATSHSPSTAYFSTFARAWELGAGALLATTGTLVAARCGRRTREALAGGGLVLVLAAAVLISPEDPWPGSLALLPVLGTLALLAAGLPGPGGTPTTTSAGRLVELPPLRWCGDISYSLYLWHWPLLVLPAAYLGRDLSLVEALGLMVAAVGVSTASYHLVENPFRHSRGLVGQGRALALWPVAVAVTAASVVLSGWLAPTPPSAVAATPATIGTLPAPAGPDENEDEEARPSLVAAVQDALVLATDPARREDPIPFPLAQDLLALNQDRVQFDDRCTAEPDETTHDLCPSGDTASSDTIVLLGDSHLNMWSPGLEPTATQQGVRLLPLIKFGCSPVEVRMLRVDVNRRYTECEEWREWARGVIARTRPMAVVVATHTDMHVLDASDEEIGGAPRDAAIEAGVRDLAESLAPLTNQVRLLGDLTRFPMYPSDCLSRRNATIGECTFPLGENAQHADGLLQSGVEGTPVEFRDITPLLCAREKCPMVSAGMSVYRDDQHVSATYAELTGPALWELFGLTPSDFRDPS